MSTVSNYCVPVGVRETRQDKTKTRTRPSQSTRVKSVPSIFLLLGPKHITQLLPHPHFLSRMHSKLKIRRRLKNEYDRTPKTEPAHLLPGSQRLTVQNWRCRRIHCLIVRPRWRRTTADICTQSLCVCYQSRETKIGGVRKTHLIKVYFNTPYVRRAYGNHAEKPVPPAPKHRNTFIQHKQILHALCHPW